MRNKMLSYGAVACAAALMMFTTVGCGHSGSSMMKQSHKSHGMHKTMNNSMNSAVDNSMSNGTGN